MQVKALAHIAERDPTLPIPRVVPSLAGTPYVWIEDENGPPHMMRVLTFLPGRIMEQVEAAFSAKTRFNIGAMVGRLAFALRDFFHPYAGSNVHLWDISRALVLRPQIAKISDPGPRRLCEEIFERAEHFTLPHLSRTRRQVVHQDSHGGNILVDSTDVTVPVGIIDFGDMAYNTIVADIVTAAETFSDRDDDPIAYLCDVTAGFDTTYPLEEAEIDLVYDAMLLRLAVATVIVEAREATDEADIPHIENAGHYPRMMTLLSRQGRAEAVRRLRAACRFPFTARRAAKRTRSPAIMTGSGGSATRTSDRSGTSTGSRCTSRAPAAPGCMPPTAPPISTSTTTCPRSAIVTRTW